MSTKALAAFVKMYGDSREGRLQSPLGRAALAELAAIQSAAKHISEGEGNEALRNCGEDYDLERSLFDSIAQEGA